MLESPILPHSIKERVRKRKISSIHPDKGYRSQLMRRGRRTGPDCLAQHPHPRINTHNHPTGTNNTSQTPRIRAGATPDIKYPGPLQEMEQTITLFFHSGKEGIRFNRTKTGDETA